VVVEASGGCGWSPGFVSHARTLRQTECQDSAGREPQTKAAQATATCASTEGGSGGMVGARTTSHISLIRYSERDFR
jgi:hypothetical protein